MSTSASFKNVINLGNSIIGVSILAMPYCFERCGILMSIVLIIASGLLTRAACHLLLKSAIIARRRNFEFLAFHILGSTGKLFVEIGILGFLLGSCIAFFVVVGDLGPSIVSEMFMVENSQKLRATVLIFLGVFVALPLGLLRTLESLTSCSAASLVLYIFLILKIFVEASPNLFSRWWISQVNFWEPSGLLACLPIFSMALACQTQLFEIFDTLNDPSLKRMNSVVSGAVNLCSLVYILVGFLGYVAFCDQPITGNILVKLPSTFSSLVTKVGFILTVVISYPLCLFPCRTSLHSLLFRRGMGHHDLSISYIPDHHFRFLTVGIVSVTVGIALVLPSIEVVLGIIGSTIGTFICIILPAFIFMRLTSKNTNERLLAQTIFTIGILIFVMCTSTTLKNAGQFQGKPAELPPTEKSKVLFESKIEDQLPKIIPSELAIIVHPSPSEGKNENVEQNKNWPEEKKPIDIQLPEIKKDSEVKRQEPPVPHEPEVKPVRPHIEPVPLKKIEPETGNIGALDPEALKKEDKEIGVPKKTSQTSQDKEKKQDEIIKKLEAQHEEHKKILEEHKKLLKELQEHKDIHLAEEKTKKEVAPLVPIVSSSPIPERPADAPAIPREIKSVEKKPQNAVEPLNVVKNEPKTNQQPQTQPPPIALQPKEIPVQDVPAKVIDQSVKQISPRQNSDDIKPPIKEPLGDVKPEVKDVPKPVELHKRSIESQSASSEGKVQVSLSSSYQNMPVPTTKQTSIESSKANDINHNNVKDQNVLKNEMRRLLAISSQPIKEVDKF